MTRGLGQKGRAVSQEAQKSKCRFPFASAAVVPSPVVSFPEIRCSLNSHQKSEMELGILFSGLILPLLLVFLHYEHEELCDVMMSTLSY